jgi:hypothetical protein
MAKATKRKASQSRRRPPVETVAQIEARVRREIANNPAATLPPGDSFPADPGQFAPFQLIRQREEDMAEDARNAIDRWLGEAAQIFSPLTAEQLAEAGYQSIPFRIGQPNGEMFVGIAEAESANPGQFAPFQDFMEWFTSEQQAHLRASALPSPPPPWPVATDDFDLRRATDRLKEDGNPLGEILERLPIQPSKDDPPGELLRCIGGPLNGQAFTIHAFKPTHATGAPPPWDTHDYVAKSASWNGLTLRWYEWQERPERFAFNTTEGMIEQSTPRAAINAQMVDWAHASRGG